MKPSLSSLPSVSERPGALLDQEAELGIWALLGFMVGTERFALPLASVREILRPLPVTELPRPPKDVVGIVSVRGTATTLIDLRSRLKVAAAPQQNHARILLIDGGSESLGLLVDAVLQVYRLRQDEIELSPSLGADAPPYIVGIGRPGSFQVEGDETPKEPDAELLVLLDPRLLTKG
jgi:purine-binding chemotaxis protein CheW